MAISIGDHSSTLFRGLSDFWLRFFRDTVDLEAFYQASEIYLGEAYLDLLGSILNIGLVDTPIFNKGYWKLFAIREDELTFSEGSVPQDDRFVYDMPGSIANIDTLQNTIFEPDVTLEKDVDFEVLTDDGFLRFYFDPFRAYTDEEGNVLPLSGVAWRFVTLETGNRLTDEKRSIDWRTNTHVKKGDTLRLVGYRGNLMEGPLASNGTYIYSSGVIRFQSSTSPHFSADNVGDIIRVYDATSDTHKGYYVIKELISTSEVYLELTEHAPVTNSPINDLSWELYRGVYLDAFGDYRIDYLDDKYLVGDKDQPYPAEEYDTPLIYSVVRDVAEPDVTGINLNDSPVLAESPSAETVTVSDVGGKVQIQVSTGTPFDNITMNKTGKPVSEFYWVTLRNSALNIQESYSILDALASPSDTAILDLSTAESPLVTGVYDWKLSKTPPSTDLGERHVIEGSVIPHARQLFGGALIEGNHYSVDYLRGIFSPLKPFDPAVIHTCSFQYQKEVVFSAAGEISEYTEGQVRQLSFWVPETHVDNFNLYYNYGSMLNRFEVSSENYRAFLRGILYLYVSGPIIQRVEAALNVAADLPVTRRDGEILQSYSSGIDDENNDGQFVDAVTNPARPFAHFITLSHVFTESDVGGYIVVADALNEVNRGKFRILNVIDTNVVEVEAPFGVANESVLEWVLTWHYKKVVTTDLYTYEFPYNISIREDIQDPDNIGVLTFVAFEPLTEAFRVVDYIEDPQWWHDKTIPEILWKNETRSRRIITTQLYEHIIGPADDARIGDPGLYIGADDEGNITQVTDGPGGPLAPVRHSAAFILFDRYMKFHMFYVQIDPNIGYDAEFLEDLEDLILVAKPSFTYPYVVPATVLEDTLALTELFQEHYGVHLGDDEELEVSDNNLIIGPTAERFMSIGDYFRYVKYVGTASGSASPPAGPFALPIAGIAPAKHHVIKLFLSATKGGKQVQEGVDYSFDYDPTAGTPWIVTPHTVWDVAGSITFDALVVEIVNLSDVATPDTTIGFTPLAIGGSDPGYVRKTILPPSYPLPIVPPPYPPYANKMEEIDRTISLIIDADGLGTPYTYP